MPATNVGMTFRSRRPRLGWGDSPVGATPEILNDQGFSYTLRGDYARAHKKFAEAQAKDPSNPYVQANLQLLEQSYHEGKAIQ
jgi:hypothetical protein